MQQLATRTGLAITVCHFPPGTSKWNTKIDRGEYPAGVTVTDAQMATVRLERHRVHGDWNYTIHPAPVTAQ